MLKRSVKPNKKRGQPFRDASKVPPTARLFMRACCGALAVLLVIGALTMLRGTSGGHVLKVSAEQWIQVSINNEQTIDQDTTASIITLHRGSTLNIAQGTVLTMESNSNSSLVDSSMLDFNIHSTLNLNGKLTGYFKNISFPDSARFNVNLYNGAIFDAKYDNFTNGQDHISYWGYNAATDGNGTIVSVKDANGNDVTPETEGRYDTLAYTFTAQPNSDAFQTIVWTRGLGGTTIGTGNSVQVTCAENAKYQVYANFIHDHVYGDPVWEWDEEHHTATATFTCIYDDCPDDDNGAVQGENVAVSSSVTAPTCTADGYTTYTASVVFDGTTFTTEGDDVLVQPDEGSALGHDLPDEWTQTQEPTCAEFGEESRACRRGGCDYTETRQVPKLPHTLTGIPAQPATCTEPGHIAYWSCTECGRYFSDADGNNEIQLSDTVVPRIPHSLTRHEAHTATCTENGNIEYWTCTMCGKHFSDENGTNEISLAQTVITAGHRPTQHEAKSAACTEAGNIEYWTCRTCGKYFSDEDCTNEIQQSATVLAALGHHMIHHEAHEASCTENGNTEYWYCDRCGGYFSDAEGNTTTSLAQTVVPASHNLTRHEAHAATCTEDGNIEYWTCDRCGGYFSDAGGNTSVTPEQTVIPAGHSLTHHAAKSATCTEAGNIEYWTCSACGKYFSDEDCTDEIQQSATVLAALGHHMIHHEAHEASCTENGNTEYWYCDRCGGYFGDAEGNTVIQLSDTVVPAAHRLTRTEYAEETCTEDGHTEYWTCSVCGRIFTDESASIEIDLSQTVIPAGHRLIHHESREANCTEPGNIEYWSCERCGKLFGDENGANEISADSVTVGTASGHSLTRHEAHAPTCTEDGNIEYWSCNRCGKYFADGNGNTETDEENVTVNALGHDWGEWQITKEPTETEEGEKERVCRREGCDAKVVVAIPANNQDPGESQVSYYFTDDSQFTWTKGGESGMLVIVKNTVAGDDGDTFEKMSRVLVDGRELDSGNYTAIEGSIRLTLKPAYLQSIDTGEHTLKVELADGSVEHLFTVRASGSSDTDTDTDKDSDKDTGKKPDPESPVTGENDLSVRCSLALLLLSLSGVVWAATRERRRTSRAESRG